MQVKCQAGYGATSALRQAQDERMEVSPNAAVHPKPVEGRCTKSLRRLAQVDNGLGNGVGGLNGFGIGLIIPLGNDQIDQFR